jgi:hypothetical protein
MAKKFSKKRQVDERMLRRIPLAPYERIIYRKYTASVDKRVQLRVVTDSSSQTFTLNFVSESAAEADFMRRMLAKALAKMIVAEGVNAESLFNEYYAEAH